MVVTHIDYDADRWFRIPAGELLKDVYEGSLTSWAIDVTALVLAGEQDVQSEEFDRFVGAFLQVAAIELDDLPVVDAFMFVPNAYDGIQLVHVLEWDVEPEIPPDEIGDLLDTLAMLHDPTAVEAPIREVTTSKGMGSGVRVLRYVLDDGALIACIGYTFYRPRSRTILELRASSLELGGFMRMLEALDEFVDGIREEAG